MNKTIIAIILVLVLIGGYLTFRNMGSTNTPSTVLSSPTVSPISQTETNVTVTQDGFNPSTITVKAGTDIIWTNKSGGPVTVNSDNHPTHLLYPELNLGEFSDGSSVSVILTKPGTYTYHNHLQPSQKGTIIVQ